MITLDDELMEIVLRERRRIHYINVNGIGCREWMRIIEPESALAEFYRKCAMFMPINRAAFKAVDIKTLQELEKDDVGS